jgi:hypothetical protein
MLRNREVFPFAEAYKRRGEVGTATINQFVEAASNFLIHFTPDKGLHCATPAEACIKVLLGAKTSRLETDILNKTI